MQDDRQNTRRPRENGERDVEPKPVKVDMDNLGPWLVDRNRKVLDMLEEYDRRREKRRSSPR